ncbi:MAG: ABC transporter ATP-binding protein, partial [Planctomycetota bacterium]
MSILKTLNLRKEYSSLVAVNDVCLDVDQGQVVGLIGPNGAGKTTLLRMLATVLPPTDGTAAISDYDLRKHPLKIRKKIGYLPDFFNLYDDLTLTECLEYFAQAYGVAPDQIPARVSQSLEYVDLTSKKDGLVKHLSRGMVQRMGLAVLLVHDPDIFLLDEPASGLDPIARIQLRDILRRLSNEGKTIIISSHILTELSGFCTHLAVMNQGSLVLQGEI